MDSRTLERCTKRGVRVRLCKGMLTKVMGFFLRNSEELLNPQQVCDRLELPERLQLPAYYAVYHLNDMGHLEAKRQNRKFRSKDGRIVKCNPMGFKLLPIEKTLDKLVKGEIRYGPK